MPVVWLEPASMPSWARGVAQSYLSKCKINPLQVKFVNLTAGHLVKLNAKKTAIDESKTAGFLQRLVQLQPDLIICNDKAALGHLTGKHMSLALCRGGAFKVAVGPRLVTVVVVDDIFKTKSTDMGGWILVQDLEKAQRHLTGKQRVEARFAYTVCDTLDKVQLALAFAKVSTVMSVDIETTAVWISCIGYTMMRTDGLIHTFVIPIINPTREGGCHWPSLQDEMMAWDMIRQINDVSAWKVLQNGSYDSCYLLIYRAPLRNYICDTLHAWHSIWTESPKKLDFISSIALDTYRYWKDEGKEDEKEDKKGGKIPKTENGMQKYWLYNALDNHNTLHVWFYLLRVLTLSRLGWALANYRMEFTQVMGPAMSMTMRGAKCNRKLQTYYALELQSQSDAALERLKIATCNPEFNPNSSPQVQEMLYDILKVAPYRNERSADEKALKMIKAQNIFADWFVDNIWQCKKPANNVSKYGSGVTLNERFMYQMSAAATETGRYGSKSHHLWVGTNVQNVPYVMRPMLEADKGYVLFDIDYAQSDAYFTAFDLQEDKMIDVMLSPQDTHCSHAAFFFKKSYDELYAAHKRKEAWVSHNVSGVRSITKRVVYGANYLMQGSTLLLTMTREPVQQAALQLGFADALQWPDRKLVKLCDILIAKYFEMYPKLRPALDNAMYHARANGNLYQCAFGRTRLFFGDLSKPATQREFASYIGQGGTAGNINRAMEKIYYGFEDRTGKLRRLETEGVMLLFQVHDSLVGQVPDSRLDLITDVQDAMTNTCELHGRKFIVPTEADCGLGWGKRLMSYTPGLTLEAIQANDMAWWEKWKAGKCI